jgi:hypothetical protein
VSADALLLKVPLEGKPLFEFLAAAVLLLLPASFRHRDFSIIPLPATQHN